MNRPEKRKENLIMFLQFDSNLRTLRFVWTWMVLLSAVLLYLATQ